MFIFGLAVLISAVALRVAYLVWVVSHIRYLEQELAVADKRLVEATEAFHSADHTSPVRWEAISEFHEALDERDFLLAELAEIH